jgi:hypothetical protein
LNSAYETLRRFAVPRLTGTAGAEHIETLVRESLAGLGYTVNDQRFTFSAWPVRHGVRTVGAVSGTALAIASILANSGRLAPALLLLLLAAATAITFVAAVGSMITHLHWSRLNGTNLWALPESGHARFLVVAHRDSKSQTIPLGLRIAAAIILVLSYAVLLASVLGLIVVSPELVIGSGVLGAVAGLVLMLCDVGNSSAGALDNASGLVTLLQVAARERGSSDVGLLVTDGEEFGLAGSRAAAALELRGIEAVINFDGVDDAGPFFILEGRLPRRNGQDLATLMSAAAHSHGLETRRRPVPPGLMLDHVPFLRIGIPALTLMRGGLRSLARVHRPADSMERLTGSGIAATVDVTCETLRQLRAGRPHHRAGARVASPSPTV